MAELGTHKSILDILYDRNSDKEVRQGIFDALKPMQSEFSKLTSSRFNNYKSHPFKTCQDLNHCPSNRARDIKVYGGTVAPAFNIYGPSGKQSLSQYKFQSHTGEIVLEGAKASGQFSIDVFKSATKNALKKAIKETLKDKAKDEVKTALFNPTN